MLINNSCQNLYKKTLLLSCRCWNHCTFLTLGFSYYTIPWTLEMSKSETNVANVSKIRLITACKARLSVFAGSRSPVLRNLWGDCKFSLLSHLDMTLQLLHARSWIIFQTALVLLSFRKFRSFAFDLPCFLWLKIHK